MQFKDIKGTQAPRSQVCHLGDRELACAAASPVLQANARYWAAPLLGAGGPVLVSRLDAVGRVSDSSHERSVLFILSRRLLLYIT